MPSRALPGQSQAPPLQCCVALRIFLDESVSGVDPVTPLSKGVDDVLAKGAGRVFDAKIAEHAEQLFMSRFERRERLALFCM